MLRLLSQAIFGLISVQLVVVPIEASGNSTNGTLNIDGLKGNKTLKDATNERKDGKHVYKCDLSPRLRSEIESYANISSQIIKAATEGAFKGKTYRELERFLDLFGHRIIGSENLERSIDYMIQYMNESGGNNTINVSTENVTFPYWIRGREEAYMIEPRQKSIAILGLGPSVPTPPGGITAEVFVVKSFAELRANASKAEGKIVVLNHAFTEYRKTVKYRLTGAVEVAKVGGVAMLVRSITPFSIYSPHTGGMVYNPNVTRIPAAAITLEDADLLYRLQNHGETIVLTLLMDDTLDGFRTSRDVIAEIPGREKPDEVVVVSGHIDSWDVGQGAMDDAGGVMISALALQLVNFLNLKPRRSLRAIMWTGEELNFNGVDYYINTHRAELDQFKAVFESDSGTFKPLGLDFAGTNEAGCIVEQVLKLLAPINATKFRHLDPVQVGTDIRQFVPYNVPTLSLNNQNDKYWYYHHTQADMLNLENTVDLDLCLALWTTASYILADLSVELPHNVSVFGKDLFAANKENPTG